MNRQTVDSANQTVGEIVAKNYQAASVFRKYGIDFCCGGGVSLQYICKKKGVDLGEITNELEQTMREMGDIPDSFNAWEPTFLIDYIIDTHHTFVRTKIPEILAYAQKVAKVYGDSHPENREIAARFEVLSKELMDHMEDEEEVVFPQIRSIYERRKRGVKISDKELNALRDGLNEMEEDHDGAGAVMAEIRALSNQYNPPESACTTYRILYKNLESFEENLHKHVHLENNILFKKALSLS
ncbi:MAG: iron-sulfur cluster repair di-iron protein [Balneolaceae bacterium]